MGLTLNDLKKILTTIPFGKKKNTLVVHLPSDNGEEHFIINDEYLKMLEFLVFSGVKINDFHYHGKKLEARVAEILERSKYKPIYCPPMPRAGNIQIKGMAAPKKKRGKLACQIFDGKGFVVLPDGTTLMCCMDYGLDYVMGNLDRDTFENVLNNEVYREVKRKMKSNYEDIICRCCHFSYAINGLGKFDEMKWGKKKIILGLKLLMFNHCGILYRWLRRIGREVGILERRQKTDDEFLRL
ncbi:SPASM domain-containing protein [Patescibacteria group bacterium]|nr:SPASM domain-containing protein [Patescibacteria group bacterium]